MAFMDRLELHYRQHQSVENDLNWYALRNTVFAIGSRLGIASFRLAQTLSAAQAQSWAYFENALSVYVNLICMALHPATTETLLLMVRTTLPGYRPRSIMMLIEIQASYCEAIGCPKLEFMLLSCATRLAQSRGFHIQAPLHGTFTEEQQATRVWLWWLLYIYDKQISIRSSRPSVRYLGPFTDAWFTEVT